MVISTESWSFRLFGLNSCLCEISREIDIHLPPNLLKFLKSGMSRLGAPDPTLEFVADLSVVKYQRNDVIL